MVCSHFEIVSKGRKLSFHLLHTSQKEWQQYKKPFHPVGTYPHSLNTSLYTGHHQDVFQHPVAFSGAPG